MMLQTPNFCDVTDEKQEKIKIQQAIYPVSSIIYILISLPLKPVLSKLLGQTNQQQFHLFCPSDNLAKRWTSPKEEAQTG